ncbi:MULTISPECIES: hypothetical protein [Halobellus]|uniref:hypothetical protein n=1 Tax=Halobellus TaxID=1073986 RepID=UPI0021095DAB|nr:MULTISPECIES: hypothetical protein [Halobellus]MDQ2055384.1 hypothetical protein [Halobellus sp. H-GB7]
MQDAPGMSCACGKGHDELKECSGYCSDCGTKLEWISRGVGAEIKACPNCN